MMAVVVIYSCTLTLHSDFCLIPTLLDSFSFAIYNTFSVPVSVRRVKRVSSVLSWNGKFTRSSRIKLPFFRKQLLRAQLM